MAFSFAKTANHQLVFFLLLIALTFSFSIETTCLADGKKCNGDMDCCSKWCRPVGEMMGSACAPTSGCSGNCPTNDCHTCTCPQQKNIINIAEYCKPTTSGWSETCCKCIVNMVTGGNSNFERNGMYFPEVGVLPIATFSLKFPPCSAPSSNICDPDANKRCAEASYANNKWTSWQAAATKCGC